MSAVGIDRIGVWPGTLAVDIGEICVARGLDRENFVGRLYCEQRSLVGPFEDVVTMAVNAARRILGPDDARDVGLLLVATESAPDQEKPVSSWVHRLLELPPTCRNLEVKHACYGATGALHLALAWLAGAPAGAKALVINTDHALLGIGGPQEPVLGAGAVAVLLARDPALVAVEVGRTGVFAREVADLFRPAAGLETGDPDESLESYLDGAEATWDAYRAVVPGARLDDFAAHVYHVPFGGLAERAHLRLCRSALGLDRAAARAHFRDRVEPSLVYARRMGGVYGGATFVALLALLARNPTLRAGDRVSVYAYGSGSCAEWYGVRVAAGARDVAAAAEVDRWVDARLPVDVATYERCERALHRSLTAEDHAPDADLAPGLWERCYAGRGHLVLDGVHRWRRAYRWS